MTTTEIFRLARSLGLSILASWAVTVFVRKFKHQYPSDVHNIARQWARHANDDQLRHLISIGKGL